MRPLADNGGKKTKWSHLRMLIKLSILSCKLLITAIIMIHISLFLYVEIPSFPGAKVGIFDVDHIHMWFQRKDTSSSFQKAAAKCGANKSQKEKKSSSSSSSSWSPPNGYVCKWLPTQWIKFPNQNVCSSWKLQRLCCRYLECQVACQMQIQFAHNRAIGWVSGAAGIIVGSPLDVLKVIEEKRKGKKEKKGIEQDQIKKLTNYGNRRDSRHRVLQQQRRQQQKPHRQPGRRWRGWSNMKGYVYRFNLDTWTRESLCMKGLDKNLYVIIVWCLIQGCACTNHGFSRYKCHSLRILRWYLASFWAAASTPLFFLRRLW